MEYTIFMYFSLFNHKLSIVYSIVNTSCILFTLVKHSLFYFLFTSKFKVKLDIRNKAPGYERFLIDF